MRLNCAVLTSLIPGYVFAGDNNAFDALRLSLGYFLQTNTRSHQRSFQGCMQMIHIDDHLVDLKAVEQGLIGTFENVSLDMCAIIDRYISQKSKPKIVIKELKTQCIVHGTCISLEGGEGLKSELCSH